MPTRNVVTGVALGVLLLAAAAWAYWVHSVPELVEPVVRHVTN